MAHSRSRRSVAGEIDVAASTLNAGLFNTVAKGAPFKLILDRGIERPGFGSMTIVASNAMVEAGYTVGKGSMLKGKRIAIQAPGSIDQYLLGREAQKAGLDPRTDLDWSSGMPYPDMVRLMGAGQTDVANIPVPLAFLVENNKFGKIVGTGADIEPNTQLGCFVMSTRFLEANRSAAVRFCMLHTYAARLFTKAAQDKDAEIIKIISDATKVPERLITAAAPRWTWYDENGNAQHRVGRCAVQLRLPDHAAGNRQGHAGGAVRPWTRQGSCRALNEKPVPMSGATLASAVTIECNEIGLTYPSKSGEPVVALET